MARFYFHLRNGGAGVTDPEGAELPDFAAAKAYATEVARELMRGCATTMRHCCVEVRDASNTVQEVIYFAEVDPALDHLDVATRAVIESLSETTRSVHEMRFQCGLAILRIEARKARAARKPYLASEHGRIILS